MEKPSSDTIKEKKDETDDKSILQKLSKIHLPKWTGCMIRGKRIDNKDNWIEKILVQTSSFDLFSNNKYSVKEFYDNFEIEYDSYGYPKGNDIDKLNKECGILSLTYLQNSPYCSACVDNPNWLHWDGRIEFNKNLGKYPSATNIYEEWKLIAKRFPILDLQCQLFDDEMCNVIENPENYSPLVQFNIKNGCVEVLFDDFDDIEMPAPTDYASFFMKLMSGMEEIVNPKYAGEAVKLVKKWWNTPIKN